MNQTAESAPCQKKDRSPLIGFVPIAFVFVVAAALTWRKWPDLLIDFGMQLYIPWKISTGSVLYHDLGYLTGGPFSQYYHAALFKIFGPSLRVIIFSNLLWSTALLVLIYRAFRAAANTFTAALIGLAVVLGFVFNQQSDIGNYNFITPYSHEVFHGVALASFGIAALARWLEQLRLRWAIAAGFCTGLVFMTKPDIFTALIAGTIVALLFSAFAQKNFGFLGKSAAAFLGMAVLPPLLFLFHFHRVESWQESFRSVAFAWVPLLGSDVSSAPFYKWCLGLDAPALNARLMLFHFLAVTAIITILALVFRRPLNISVNRLLAVAAVAGSMALASLFNWVDCGRSLPLLLGTLIILLIRNRQKLAIDKVAVVFPLLWAVFSLALMAKLGLFPRVWHYGFALAMPAFVGAVYLLHMLLPHLLKTFNVSERYLRITIALLIVLGVTRLFVQSQSIYHHKTLTVGSGADRILAFNSAHTPRDAALAEALNRIRELPADATLAVMPEGVMLNYLSRRTNPTHYFLWNPHELAAFGQEAMTADFKQRTPDYVLLVQRDSSEYEVNYFGKDDRFGGEVMRWIQNHYQPVWLIGDEPLQNNKFGIKLLKRGDGQ